MYFSTSPSDCQPTSNGRLRLAVIGAVPRSGSGGACSPRILTVILCTILPLLTIAESSQMPNKGRTADQLSIERLIGSLDDAWARGDAGAFASRFANDGTFTNFLGMF